MNILVFSRGHISKFRGGVDRVIETISKELEKRGHLVYMISVCAPVGNDVLRNNQFVLPDKETLSKINKGFVTDIYKKFNINIILNQSDVKSIFDLIIDTHKGIPIISYYHCDPLAITKGVLDNWDEWKLTKGYKFWALFPYYLLRCAYQYHTRKKYISFKHKEYYNKSDAVILLSEKFKNSFLKVTKIKDTRKLHFISNPNTYSQSICEIEKKENIIIFVGRLDFQKRVDRLLNVWKIISKKHSNWKLQIVGDGSHKSFYEQLAKSLSLHNIEFKGMCDPTEFYKKAKVICLTSSHEGLPMVILEALQYNVIPIAYNSFESITDIIDDNINGFLIKPFSIKGFASKLAELIENKKLTEMMQQNISKSNIEDKFNVQKIADQLERIFKEIT